MAKRPYGPHWPSLAVPEAAVCALKAALYNRRKPMPPSQNPPNGDAQPPREDRLESWKRIANYCKRGERTVRRWEQSEGLPVHRLLHDKSSTVYAYKSELDAWWAARRPELDKVATRGVFWRGRGVWLLAGPVLIALAASVAYLFKPPDALPFAERDWVLLTRFENRTGETVFDGTVEYALGLELSNSRYVNVVPQERITDALGLMRMPPDTPVDRAIGREVSLRDGAIRALIDGRVEKLENTYLISAVLVDPADGRNVRSFSERARGQREAVAAVERLAVRVRRHLGEELGGIEQSLQELEKVSTPSLYALQLYSQADALMQEYRPDQAATLLARAVEEDAGFASAHLLLAYALFNLGRQEEAAPHFEQAMRLADTATDRERYFIHASNYQRHPEQNARATESLELLVRLHPDYYWAVSNLSNLYEQTGQPLRALPYTQRRADLRPNNFDLQIRAAQQLVVWGDRGHAEPYLERARRLAAVEDVGPWRTAWLSVFPVHALWIRGDAGLALELLAESSGDLRAGETPGRYARQWYAASFNLNLGRLGEARDIWRGMDNSGEAGALLAWALGEKESAREALLHTPPSYQQAILLARMGLLGEAERMIAHPEAPAQVYAPYLPYIWNDLARGELALARGQSKEAVDLLEPTVQRLRPWPSAFFFLGVDALARALELKGDLPGSLQVLEQAAQYKAPAIFWGPALHFWMQNELQRTALYHRLGRADEAGKVRVEILELLVHADAGHPVVNDLTRNRGLPGIDN